MAACVGEREASLRPRGLTCLFTCKHLFLCKALKITHYYVSTNPSRIWSTSWRPSLWRTSSLTEVCCTKGNWCSQVSGTNPAHFTRSALQFEQNLTPFLFGFVTREHKADRCLSVPVWRIPADHKDKEKQKGFPPSYSVLALTWTQGGKSGSDLWFSAQRSTSSEQNSLRLQQNLELDQLLKEGCTFTVLDQPISLDRLQLKNIDQLNASSKHDSVVSSCVEMNTGSRVKQFVFNSFSGSFTASGLPHSFIIMHHNRYQQCIGAFILQAASEAAKVEHFNPEVLTGGVRFSERSNRSSQPVKLYQDTHLDRSHNFWGKSYKSVNLFLNKGRLLTQHPKIRLEAFNCQMFAFFTSVFVGNHLI